MPGDPNVTRGHPPIGSRSAAAAAAELAAVGWAVGSLFDFFFGCVVCWGVFGGVLLWRGLGTRILHGFTSKGLRMFTNYEVFWRFGVEGNGVLEACMG